MTAEQIDPNRAPEASLQTREVREGNLFPRVILLAAADCAGNCAAMQISLRAGKSQASFRNVFLSRYLANLALVNSLVRAGESRAEARPEERRKTGGRIS